VQLPCDPFFGCFKITSIRIAPNVHVAELSVLKATKKLWTLNRMIRVGWAPCTYRTLAGDQILVRLPESELDLKTNVTQLVWETVAAELRMLPEDIYFARRVVLFRPTITVSVLRMRHVSWTSRRQKAMRFRELSEGGSSNISNLSVALAVETGASDQRAATPTTLRYAQAKIGKAMGIPPSEIPRLELWIAGTTGKSVKPKLDLPLAGLLGEGTCIAVTLRGRLGWPKTIPSPGQMTASLDGGKPPS